jgi:hypothetical protein
MSKNLRKILRDIGFWLAELLVIFLGVYLAFMLKSHRINRQREQKRQQIYTSLYRYFSVAAPSLKKSFARSDSTYFEPFLKSYQKDEMPQLQIPGFFRNV